MAGIQFWEANPETHEAVKIDAVAKDKPILVFLTGISDFPINNFTDKLHKAIFSYVESAGIEAKDIAIYVPKLMGLQRSYWRGNTDHATEMAEILIPDVPATVAELKQCLSRLTVMGYSHGCIETGILANKLREHITKNTQLSEAEIDDAMKSLAIFNIATEKMGEHFPDYALAPAYTVVSGYDSTVYTDLHYRARPTEEIKADFDKRNLVVVDNICPLPLTLVKLNPASSESVPFSSRLNGRKESDWQLLPESEDGLFVHGMHSHMNTHRFIPSKDKDKGIYAYPSMVVAPVTLGVLADFLRASQRATIDTPRDAHEILQSWHDKLSSAEYLNSLKSDFDRAHDHYRSIETDSRLR